MSLLLPWRRGLSAVWLAPAQPLGKRNVYLIIGLTVLASFVAVGLSCVTVRQNWEIAGLRAEGGYHWYWYGKTVVSHWSDLVGPKAGGSRSVLHGYGNSIASRKLAPHEGPPRIRGQEVQVEYHRTVMQFHMFRSQLLLWRFMALWPIAFVVLMGLMPPIGLWIAGTPESRFSLFRIGARRCFWLAVTAIFWQGLFLSLLQIYDLLSPIVKWPYIGIGIVGFEMIMPLLIFEVLLYRAIGFDRQAHVFRYPWRAKCLILLGMLFLCLIGYVMNFVIIAMA